MGNLTRADNKEGSRVKIEVTRVNYGRDSLPFIQGKLLADDEGEMVGYDSGIEVKSEAGTPIPPVTEKRKRDKEEEEGDQKLIETKKSKKRKHLDVKEEIVSEPEIKQEPKVTEPVLKKKKKKDKEKEKINDVSEVEVKTELDPSDIPKKKKKKNKGRENEEVVPSPVEIKQEPEEVLPVEKK